LRRSGRCVFFGRTGGFVSVAGVSLEVEDVLFIVIWVRRFTEVDHYLQGVSILGVHILCLEEEIEGAKRMLGLPMLGEPP